MNKTTPLLHKCQRIVKTLTTGTVLEKWHIRVEISVREPAPDEKYVSAEVVYDETLQRAVIYVDPRCPRPEELYTLDEIMAHELGHIIAGEALNDNEPLATRIGQLLMQYHPS